MTRKNESLMVKILKDAAENCLCFNARKTARTITKFYDQHFAGSKVEPAQFNILVALRLTQPVALVQLAEHLGLERTTFTRNLRVLQRNGFVAIQRGEDARNRLLSLSPSGEQALKNALPRWQHAQQAAISALGANDFTRVSKAFSLSTKFTKTKKNQS